MAFTPEAPEFPEDLYTMFDTDADEVSVLMYSCDQGDFYRHKSKWVAILSTDDTTIDIEGLLIVPVLPSFTPIYDETEAASEAVDMEELQQYYPQNVGTE